MCIGGCFVVVWLSVIVSAIAPFVSQCLEITCQHIWRIIVIAAVTSLCVVVETTRPAFDDRYNCVYINNGVDVGAGVNIN